MNLLKNFGLTAMAFIILACGGKRTQEKEESEDEILNEYQSEEVVTSVVEPEPEPSNPSKDEYGNLIYHPPFSFKAYKEYYKKEFDRETENYVDRPVHKFTLQITVDKNGRFKGTRQDLFLRYGDYYFVYEHPDTIGNQIVELNGKWEDSWISMGNGYLDCYSFECSDFEDWSLFLLGNCEYAWYAKWPRLEAQDWNTQSAMTISDIKVL